MNEISAIRRIRPANLRGDPRQVQSAAGRAVRQVFRRGQIRRWTRKQGKFGESNFAPQLNFILSLLCEGRRATTQGGAWTGSGWRVSLGSEKEVWRQPDMRPCCQKSVKVVHNATLQDSGVAHHKIALLSFAPVTSY